MVKSWGEETFGGKIELIGFALTLAPFQQPSG